MAAKRAPCVFPLSEVTSLIGSSFCSRRKLQRRIVSRCPGDAALFVTLIFFIFYPVSTRAWGKSAQKLVVNQAIDTLPPELRPFFEANRAYLVQHVTDPLEIAEKKSPEKHNHFVMLDRYGRFPFDALPRSYKAALSKYGKSKIELTGVLPWEIGVYGEKLTEALKAGRWEEAKLNAAFLADYVAEARDPFNTTENFDGQLTGQANINERFGTTLIDRYSSFFPMRPNDAAFISDTTDHAFEACISSHSWLEPILLVDRNAKRGKKSYNDEHFDVFSNQSEAILIRQLSEAATDVGSYWLTAWINAGKPQLPH